VKSAPRDRGVEFNRPTDSERTTLGRPRPFVVAFPRSDHSVSVSADRSRGPPESMTPSLAKGLGGRHRSARKQDWLCDHTTNGGLGGKENHRRRWEKPGRFRHFRGAWSGARSSIAFMPGRGGGGDLLGQRGKEVIGGPRLRENLRRQTRRRPASVQRAVCWNGVTQEWPSRTSPPAVLCFPMCAHFCSIPLWWGPTCSEQWHSGGHFAKFRKTSNRAHFGPAVFALGPKEKHS